MKFSVRKSILIITFILVVLSFIIFFDFFTSDMNGWGVLVGIILVYAIEGFVLWRCPHCKAYLGRLSFFAKYCPHCSKELE